MKDSNSANHMFRQWLRLAPPLSPALHIRCSRQHGSADACVTNLPKLMSWV